MEESPDLKPCCLHHEINLFLIKFSHSLVVCINHSIELQYMHQKVDDDCGTMSSLVLQKYENLYNTLYIYIIKRLSDFIEPLLYKLFSCLM